MILEHSKSILKMNNNPDSKLYNMVDKNNIGLIGHSRGGEASSIAASINSEYNIKAVLTLAPTYKQYPKNITLNNISYLSIHGANDGDLKTFKGVNQYNRVNFDNKEFNFKASYYIEGVNHNQFKSDWGLIDQTSLGKIYSSRASNIDFIDQREITRVFSKIFFNIILKNRMDLLPKIREPSLNKTLPEITYITNYQDSHTKILCDFKYNMDNISYKNFNNSIKIIIGY